MAIFIAQLILGASTSDWVFPLAIGVLCVAAAAAERDPRKNAKKPLAMTARAKRIYAVSLVLLTAVGIAAGFATNIALVWLVPVQLVPVALVAGTLLLMPSETRVQRRYWQEAHDTLQRLGPIVVAVTGSYGKTSVSTPRPRTETCRLIIQRQRQQRGDPPSSASSSPASPLSWSKWAPTASARSPALRATTPLDHPASARRGQALQDIRRGGAREVRAGRGGARQ